MLMRLLPALRARGLESTVITLRRTEQAISPSLAARAHCLNMTKSPADVLAPLALRRLLRRSQSDVVQTWLYHADLLGILTSVMTPGSRTIWNIRSANTGHLYTSGTGRLLVRALSTLSRFPAAVVANSQAGIEEHTRLGYRPREWVLIPNGLDAAWFEDEPDAAGRLKTELSLPPSACLVGLIGRYDPLKDHKSFLVAARQILGKLGRDTHFILAGDRVDNDNAALVAQVRALGLSKNVHLLGVRSDLRYVNQGLDVATCTSIGEGFPNTLLEALASGTLCVSTDVGDARRIVGRFGAIVPPKEPGVFADAVVRVLSMAGDTRKSLERTARAQAKETYCIADIARHYEALYRRVAAR